MPRNNEPHGIGPGPQEMADGRALFASLDHAQQLALAHEIAMTRGDELARAYPDVASLGFGFKTKKHSPRGREKLTGLPCVIFEVDRKLSLKAPRHARRHLPKELMTFIGPMDDRKLCVVPTDVKETKAFGRPRPTAGEPDRGFGIAVSLDDPQEGVGGNVAVSLQMGDGSLHAISCRHVLSRSLVNEPDIVGNARVSATLVGNWMPLGRTTSTRGRFIEAPELSFDAQLLRVADPNACRAAVGPLRFNSYLQSPGQLPGRFFVATPRIDVTGARIIVEVEQLDWNQARAMPYPFPRRMVMIAHALVFHGRTAEPLIRGDSGSPAMSTPQGGVLLGMYFGGDDENAYFIPAWQLFRAGNYGKPAVTWGMAG